ncbi:MAG: hypothetical protein ACRDI0_13990 [Actinomycetota bacterium]
MTDNPAHQETRALAAELAMDVATGVERGRALAHLEVCRECRSLVADMAEAKDEVLLLAPEREPSAGFETRTLTHLARLSRPPRGPRWRRILSLSVAASVAAAAGVGGAWLATRTDRQAADLFRTALERADGKYLGVEVLRRPDGTRVGHLAVYLGRPSWIFAVLDEGSPVGTFDVEIVGPSGDRRPAGVLTIETGRRGAGLVLPPGLERVAAVVLVPRAGGDPLEGRLPAPAS